MRQDITLAINQIFADLNIQPNDQAAIKIYNLLAQHFTPAEETPADWAAVALVSKYAAEDKVHATEHAPALTAPKEKPDVSEDADSTAFLTNDAKIAVDEEAASKPLTLRALVELLTDYDFHVDGQFHLPENQRAEKTASVDIEEISAWKLFLKRFFNTTAFAFQIVNTVEVLAITTALWEWFPDRLFGAIDATYLVPLVPGVAWNNYKYTLPSYVQHAPHIYKKAYKVAFNNMLEKFQPFGLGEVTVNKLLGATGARRWLAVEYPSYANLFTKLGATIAVFSALFKDEYPWYAILALATVAGLVEAVDTAFTKVIAIAQEYSNLDRFGRDNFMVPAEGRYDGPGFSQFSNFAPIPWLMTTIGPLLWAGVKIKALGEFAKTFELSGIAADILQVLSGTFLISALTYGNVFSRYSVREKLAKELPTKRDLSLTGITQAMQQHVGVAFLAAQIMVMPLAYIAHHFALKENKYIADGISAGVYSVLSAGATYVLHHHNWEKTRYYYSKFITLDWVTDLFAKVDHMNNTDRAIAVGVHTVAAGVAMCVNQFAVAGMAATGTALLLSGLLSAENRMYARYILTQSMFYATAVLTFYVNFVQKMVAEVEHKNVADTPNTLNINAGWQPIVLMATFILMGWRAANGDYKATAAQLVDQSETRDQKAQKSSVVGLFNRCRYGQAATQRITAQPAAGSEMTNTPPSQKIRNENSAPTCARRIGSSD